MKNKTVTRLFAGVLVTALIVTGTVVPPTTAQAKTRSVTIHTQKELNDALNNPKLDSIIIKTSKGITFKIPKGDYDKKLTIKAPKATVNNYGSFDKIVVADGKTVYDKGEDNNIVVKDTNKLKLVVGKKAIDTDVTIAAKGGKITIVSNGDLDTINVKSKSTVTLSGSSEETPVIKNNAKGSKIVTKMDAELVLNKDANVTVKKGCVIESLTVKKNTKVVIEEGATVKQLIIEGEESDVALNVEGSVEQIVVNKKSNVTISGSATDTVKIENNAAGTVITSETKADITLNASAKVDLEKGAEGTTVTTAKADVKADVKNDTTEKVTVTDADGKDTTVDAGKTTTDDKNTTDDKTPSGGGASGGSSSGGSSSGSSSSGGSSSSQVQATLNVGVDTATLDTLQAGVTVTASAITTADPDAAFTYTWVVNDKVVSNTDRYAIQAKDAGYKLIVTATTTVNGTKVTATKELYIKAKYDSNSLAGGTTLTVANGTSDADVIAKLPAKAVIYDSGKVNAKEVNVTWAAPDGYAVTEGTYTFTGTLTANGDWIGVDSASVTATVKVLAADALTYTVSVASITHNEGQSSADTTAASQANQNMVTLSGSGYDYTVSAPLSKLNSFASSDAGQSNGKWIGLLVNVGKTVKDNLFWGTSADGGTKITETDDQAGDNGLIFWVKADELAKGAVTRYMRYGESGTAVPLTIRFENTDTVIARFDTIADVNAGVYKNATAVADLNLPTTVTAYDSKGNRVSVPVKDWTNTDTYDAESSEVGSYTFTATFADDPEYDISGAGELTVEVVLGQAECDTTLNAPTVKTVAKDSIELNAITSGTDTVEYACVTTNTAPESGWDTATTFTGLTAGTTYYFFARVKESKNYKAGAASAALEAATSAESAITVTTMSSDLYAAYKKSIPEGNNTTAPDAVSAFDSGLTFTSDTSDPTRIKVTGTLNYIDAFGMFGNGNSENSSGNYLLWQVAVPEGVDTSKASLTIKKGDTKINYDEQGNPFDTIDGKSYASMIYRVTDEKKSITITVDWDGTGTKYVETTYTLDLSEVTLGTQPTASEGE